MYNVVNTYFILA